MSLDNGPRFFVPLCDVLFLPTGGIEITLDAEKMMGLMNLKPQLSLADCGLMLTHHPGSSDHQRDRGQDGGHKQGYGPKEEQGPKQDDFYEQSHAMANQNMTTCEDSEEELIDDLLKDV